MAQRDNIRILRVTETDTALIKGISEIENECIPNPWSEKLFYDEAKKNNSYIFAAVDSDTICGFITSSYGIDEINIDNVAVSPDYRRYGIAKKLINTLFKAIPQNTVLANLEVRESNDAAIKLYESFGFECVGLRKRYYTNPDEGAVLMTKYFEKGDTDLC